MTIPDLEFQCTSIGDAAPWLESATKISPTVAFESESFFLSKATCVTKPVVAPQSRSKIASLKLPPGSGTSRTKLFPQAEEHEDVTERRLASANSRTTDSHLNCLADALVAVRNIVIVPRIYLFLVGRIIAVRRRTQGGPKRRKEALANRPLSCPTGSSQGDLARYALLRGS